MSVPRVGRFVTAIALLGALAGVPGRAAPCAAPDWPMYGHDLGHSFSANPLCTAVNASNVTTLIPKWFVNTSSPVTAPPVVVGGKLYVGDYGGTFRMIDANDGTVLHTFSVTDANPSDYGKIVDSASVANVGGTNVVVFAGGSTLYVLDASDLTLLTSECFDPRPDPSVQCKGADSTIEIESSPAVVRMPNGETRIVVGMDFNESPNVGRAGLVELRLDHVGSSWDLVPLWKFDPETLQTYTVDPLHTGGAGFGCGNVWSSPAIDVARNLVFFGVGNCEQDPSPEPGDGEAIVAVALDTGAVQWRFMPRPGNNGLDLDFGSSAQLLDGGRVGEAGKDGFYYAFDEGGSEPKWTSHVSTASDNGGIIGSTALGSAGGHSAIFASSAIPISSRDPQGSFSDALSTPGHAMALHAIDATTGAKLWDAPIPFPAYGAVSFATSRSEGPAAPGVVFLPDTFSFTIQAWSADTGLPLWAFPLNGAPSSAPAIVGDSIYLGTGTNAPPVPLDSLGGIWAFHLAL